MRLFATLLLLAGLAVGIAPTASACSAGNFYDPMHQICAPYPPTNCPPQYWQACAGPIAGDLLDRYPDSIDVPDLSPPVRVGQ